MFSNHIKVMFRNMARHKLYSFITILGLTAGIAFALVIGVFTWTEMQVNRDLVDVDRLYKLETNYKADNGSPLFVPMPLTSVASESYPGIIESAYGFLDRNITVSKGDKHLRLQCMIGDSTFIQIFGFSVISGNASRALSEPNTIVITQTVAQQFFNRTDVSGEILEISTEGGGVKHFEVSAVIQNPQKKNSVTDLVNMDAQVFLPLLNAQDFSLGVPDPTNWNSVIISYVKLSRNTTAAEAAKVFNNTIQKHAPEMIRDNQVVELVSLEDYYRLTNSAAVQKLIITLVVIVIFILWLAICNFINITISGSFSRLREAGVRKVIGGLKRQLVFQFVAESMVYAWISALLGIVIFELLREYFAVVLASDLPSVFKLPSTFWLAAVAAVTLVGVLAGIYPAIYLSSTGTLESLKGKYRSVKGTINFSRVLVGIQFLLSIFIMIGAVIMSGQINYFMEKDLGYDKDAVLVVTSAPRLWTPEGYSKMEAAKRELLRSPAVASISLSTGSPSAQFNMIDDVVYKTGSTAEEGISAAVTGSDEDFAKVYKMKMVEGRFFNAAGEARVPFTVVINEAAQKALGINLGDLVRLQGNADQDYQVIGIIKDFNYETLHQSIRPAVFLHSAEYLAFRFFSIKLNPGPIAARISEIESAWQAAFPDDAFVSSFADDRLEQRYKTEMQLKRASSLASALMLIIVMTGVLGLVALTVAKRTKEIGIRKVLGASVSQILSLLAKEYAIVMIVSFALAIPLSYLFINQWLSGFVYHIPLQWWMFGLPPALVFIVTMMIVAIQSMGTAVANPVKSLRYE